MGYLYNGFCYSSPESIGIAISSYRGLPQILTTNPITYSITSLQSPGSIQLGAFADGSHRFTPIFKTVFYNQQSIATGDFWHSAELRIFSCNNPGNYAETMNLTIPQNSITLQTPASLESPPPVDVATASTLVVTVLAAAWAFKVLRRTL